MSCGQPLAGAWCHACGEKRRDPRDLTVRAFLHYAVEAVTNADAKLYVTLRALFRQPGLLTRDFVAGRRRRWIAPLQLFLIANLIFFVLLQLGLGMNTFTTDLIYHPQQPIYGPAARSLLEERIAPLPPRDGVPVDAWARSWSEEQLAFRTRFNEATPRYANSLVILIVPLFAAGLLLLRRRALLVRELVLSFHFFAFLLLYSTVLSILIRGVYRVAPWVFAYDSELLIAVVIIAPAAVWLTSAFRTVHGDGRAAAIARALVAVALLFLALTLYRAILFFVVFWLV